MPICHIQEEKVYAYITFPVNICKHTWPWSQFINSSGSEQLTNGSLLLGLPAINDRCISVLLFLFFHSPCPETFYCSFSTAHLQPKVIFLDKYSVALNFAYNYNLFNHRRIPADVEFKVAYSNKRSQFSSLAQIKNHRCSISIRHALIIS